MAHLNEQDSALANEQCEACRVGAPQISETEELLLLREIPQWQIQSPEGIKQLVRSFDFPNFINALAFANRAGELAESVCHHPSILVEWGKVTVSWWTHKINGLHRNDFIMAARTDKLHR